MKLLLDVYKGAAKDLRDRAEVIIINLIVCVAWVVPATAVTIHKGTAKDGVCWVQINPLFNPMCWKTTFYETKFELA